MDAITHLLDTHAVIWAYDDAKFLGAQARAVISHAMPLSLGISDFTLFEIAMLVSKGRLQLDLSVETFLQRVETDYVVLPLGALEAASAMELNLEQADPFDRAIVATALSRNIPLLSKDRQIAASGLLSVIW